MSTKPSPLSLLLNICPSWCCNPQSCHCSKTPLTGNRSAQSTCRINRNHPSPLDNHNHLELLQPASLVLLVKPPQPVDYLARARILQQHLALVSLEVQLQAQLPQALPSEAQNQLANHPPLAGAEVVEVVPLGVQISQPRAGSASVGPRRTMPLVEVVEVESLVKPRQAHHKRQAPQPHQMLSLGFLRPTSLQMHQRGKAKIPICLVEELVLEMHSVWGQMQRLLAKLHLQASPHHRSTATRRHLQGHLQAATLPQGVLLVLANPRTRPRTLSQSQTHHHPLHRQCSATLVSLLHLG